MSLDTSREPPEGFSKRQKCSTQHIYVGMIMGTIWVVSRTLILDETWPAPVHENPLSVVDQVKFQLNSSHILLAGGVDPGADGAGYTFQ